MTRRAAAVLSALVALCAAVLPAVHAQAGVEAGERREVGPGGLTLALDGSVALDAGTAGASLLAANVRDELTVEAWVSLAEAAEGSDAADVRSVVSLSSAGGGFLLGFDGRGWLWGVAAGGDVANASSHVDVMRFAREDAHSPPLGEWFYVVASWDGKHRRLFVDGELRAEESGGAGGAIAFDDSSIGTELLIMAQSNGGTLRRVSGAVDDVALWRRAFTAEEVRDKSRSRASNRKTLRGAVMHMSPLLLAYYSFDDDRAGSAIAADSTLNNLDADIVGPPGSFSYEPDTTVEELAGAVEPYAPLHVKVAEARHAVHDAASEALHRLRAARSVVADVRDAAAEAEAAVRADADELDVAQMMGADAKQMDELAARAQQLRDFQTRLDAERRKAEEAINAREAAFQAAKARLEALPPLAPRKPAESQGDVMSALAHDLRAALAKSASSSPSSHDSMLTAITGMRNAIRFEKGASAREEEGVTERCRGQKSAAREAAAHSEKLLREGKLELAQLRAQLADVRQQLQDNAAQLADVRQFARASRRLAGRVGKAERTRALSAAKTDAQLASALQTVRAAHKVIVKAAAEHSKQLDAAGKDATRVAAGDDWTSAVDWDALLQLSSAQGSAHRDGALHPLLPQALALLQTAAATQAAAGRGPLTHKLRKASLMLDDVAQSLHSARRTWADYAAVKPGASMAASHDATMLPLKLGSLTATLKLARLRLQSQRRLAHANVDNARTHAHQLRQLLRWQQDFLQDVSANCRLTLTQLRTNRRRRSIAMGVLARLATLLRDDSKQPLSQAAFAARVDALIAQLPTSPAPVKRAVRPPFLDSTLRYCIYTIRAGDSLQALTHKFAVGFGEILRANSGLRRGDPKDSFFPPPGEKLWIPVKPAKFPKLCHAARNASGTWEGPEVEEQVVEHVLSPAATGPTGGVPYDPMLEDVPLPTVNEDGMMAFDKTFDEQYSWKSDLIPHDAKRQPLPAETADKVAHAVHSGDTSELEPHAPPAATAGITDDESSEALDAVTASFDALEKQLDSQVSEQVRADEEEEDAGAAPILGLL